MKIIPAIFLQNGHVVSLYKGNENDQKKVYPKSAKNYAEFFAKKGADIIEVIDLDGKNREKIHEIREVFDGELWWGGQIREIQEVESLFAYGASKVILGEGAKEIYSEALEKFGAEKLLAGIKFRNDPDAPDKCAELSAIGFTDIIVKDLEADGTLYHPNFDQIEKCVIFSKARIYSSGGVAQYDHIEYLKQAGASGAVIGRALYENALDLKRLIDRSES